jgi:general stress protein YciG
MAEQQLDAAGERQQLEGAEGPLFSKDREAAREAGRRGGLRRQELARLKREDPEAWARETFAAERAGLSNLLLDAAYGRGTFAGDIECQECGAHVSIPLLPPEKRLGAVVKAMEYAIGRPTPRKDAEPATPEEGGLSIE